MTENKKIPLKLRDIVEDNQLALIIYYGRSGSVFIHSLLDGHPQVISMPPVLMSYITDLNKYQPDLSTADNAYKYFIEIFGRLINSDEEYSRQDFVSELIENMNLKINSEIQEEVFRSHFNYYFKTLEKIINDKHKLLFLVMHYAYDSTLYNYRDLDVVRKKKIVCQLHNPIFWHIGWFAKQFNGLSLLQMIRSPLVALRSLIKFYIEVDDFSPQQMQNVFKQILFGGTAFDSCNVDHFAVKLEDIHHQPEQTLRKIANRLSIDWNDTLLLSSFSKVPWGNVKGRDNISGFSPNSTHSDISDMIPDIDLAFLLPLLKKRYQFWGYELPEITSKIDGPSQQHSILLEYIAYLKDPTLVNEHHKKQSLTFRSEQMQFCVRYGSRFDADLVKVL